MIKRVTIWNKWWFLDYSSEAKLLYVYFCTNPFSSIYGIQRHSLKKVCFDNDLSEEQVRLALKELNKKVASFFDEGDRLFWTYVVDYFSEFSGNVRGEFSSDTKPLKNIRQLKGFQQFYMTSKFPKELKERLNKDLHRVIKENFKPLTIPLSRKEVIAIRDNFKCVYCNKEFYASNEIELDHLHPKAKGGDDSWENLVASCKTCNLEKLDLLIEDKEEYKPDPNYRKFEAIADLKKPEIFTKYREVFNSSLSQDAIKEELEDNHQQSPKIKRKTGYEVVCGILEKSSEPLNINQIQQIIRKNNLLTNRVGKIPSLESLSVYISGGNKRYNLIETKRVGKKYLYSLKK